MKKKKSILVFLLFLILPFFFFFGPGYGSSRSFQCFWDLGHIVFFALASYFLITFPSCLSEKSFKLQLFWVVLITLVGGLLIELIQAGFSRTPSFPDMLRNLVGSLCSLFFFNPDRTEWPAKKLNIFQFFIILAVVSATIPLGVAITDESIAEAEFPLLADFRNALGKEPVGGPCRKAYCEHHGFQRSVVHWKCLWGPQLIRVLPLFTFLPNGKATRCFPLMFTTLRQSLFG